MALPHDDESSGGGSRLRCLVDRLDCFTEEDFLLLTDASPSTLEQWRKRGEGPAYIRAANRILYPRQAVVDWLQTRLRERPSVPVGRML